jgi:tetratricopeptide (TPR) repeat protein
MLYLFAAVVAFILLRYLLHRLGRRGGLAQSLQATKAIDDVLAAYRRADYDDALRKAEGLKKGSSKTATYCYFRGKMLYELGHLRDAEANLRKSISLEEDAGGRRAALGRESLGYALLEQGEYAGAIGCFEDSIRLWPDRGAAHRAIAEVLLREGGSNTETLTRARRAAETDRAARALSNEIHDHNLSTSLATLAWAVAAGAGDPAEVERLLAEAVPLCGNDTKPVVAQGHYYAGRAYLALGLLEESGRHFEQAIATDPQGNYGRLSLAMASTGATP